MNTVREFCEEVGKYLDMSKITYVGQKLEYDKVEQNVENSVFAPDLSYKSIKEGLEYEFKRYAK